jgi:NADH dehydrogenase FAD-containing subunit
VFVVGDGAMTKQSGMAQTALGDGKLVAENIVARLAGKKMKERVQEEPIYAIPCGPGWAAVLMGGRQYYGRVGWWLRRYLDWVVFTSLLPVRKAWLAFASGKQVSESCLVCCGEEGEDGEG